MFMIWLIGAIFVLCYRCFDAGMNTKKNFYTNIKGRYGEPDKFDIDSDKVGGYFMLTFVFSFLSFFSIIGYTLYVIGKKFNKE